MIRQPRVQYTLRIQDLEPSTLCYTAVYVAVHDRQKMAIDQALVIEALVLRLVHRLPSVPAAP